MTTEIEIVKSGEIFVVPLTAEIMRQSGLKEGEKIKVSVENGKIEIRPLAEVELEARVDEIVDGLIEKRRDAYERLAEGA
jgi:antitoxin component of MazEF toxin-antitoxin module